MAGVVVPPPGCPGIEAVNPICQLGGAAGDVVGGAVSSVANAGVGAVFQGLTGWVVDGAGWLVRQVGGALSGSTSVDVGAGWFRSHYQVMLGLLGVVLVPLLIGSVVHAVVRQDAGALVRSFGVHLPLAVLLAAGGIKLVQLGLAVTDELSTVVSHGAGADLHGAMTGVASGLSGAAADPAIPAFVALLGAVLVVIGALALWVELLVRAAAVYVAVLFLPLALGSLVWPRISHWCRRLVDALSALILSKFVIVAVLSLAAGALAAGVSGSGGGSTGAAGAAGVSGAAGGAGAGAGGGAGGGAFPAVLGGAALLLLAAFTPYALLRLVPLVEAGAIGHLEGARHRAQHVATSVPRSAASFALRQARLSAFDAGVPGTGDRAGFDAPGSDDGTFGSPGDDAYHAGHRSDGDPGGGDPGPSGSGARVPDPSWGTGGPGGDGVDGAPSRIPMWQGNRRATEAYEAVMAGWDEGPDPGSAPAGGGAPGPPTAPGPGSVPPSGSPPPATRPKRWTVRGTFVDGPTAADGGTHVLGDDGHGPVIRWVPPEPGAGAGDRTGAPGA